VIVVAETSVSVRVVVAGDALPSSAAAPHPVATAAAIDVAIVITQIRVEKRAFAVVFIEQIPSLPTHSHRRNRRRNS
jgi:hypothetical protein